MKKTIYNIALSMAAVALSLTSCVKDDLFDTPHPDKGAVVVTADWSGKSSEAVLPDDYTIEIGNQSQSVSGDRNLFASLLMPRDYPLFVHNAPVDMTLDATTATVRRSATGGIPPMPGYLFAHVQDIYVQCDDTLKVTAPMRQYVRRLDIELTVSEGDYGRVASATATLGGAASTVNIATGERGNAATTVNELAQSGNVFSTAFRLLGVIPSAGNILTVDVMFTNGDTQTIVSDLSAILRDFNSAVEPMKLTGDLFLPVESGFAGSITGWQQVDAGNTDAH